MKTIIETLDGGTQWLEQKGIEDARRNMQLLICHQLDMSKIQLYTSFDQQISEQDLIPLREKLKLRGEGTPLQHLLGTVEFLRREFKTDGRALIPRPETEELVEIATERINQKLLFTDEVIETLTNQPNKEETAEEQEEANLAEPEKSKYKILDMGCGSGIIGISLAAELGMRVEVTCVDISEEALNLAKENCELLGINNVTFLHSDLFSNIDESYDFIIANLPYVPETERPSLAPELDHDPDLALYGGKDGLDIIKIFCSQLPSFLNDEASIALEIGINQHIQVEQLLRQTGCQDIRTQQDISGIARFPIATFSKSN